MLGRLHDGGAGDHVGAAVIHFDDDHGTVLTAAEHGHGEVRTAQLLADRL